MGAREVKAMSDGELVCVVKGIEEPDHEPKAQEAQAKKVYGISHTRDPEDGWKGAFASREEAIAWGREEYEGDDFWILRCERCDPARFVMAASRIIEDMEEVAYDEVGAEDWPIVTQTGRTELDALLEQWARKYCTGTLWEYDGSEPELITGEPAPPSVLP
jgi:hypothetical protein